MDFLVPNRRFELNNRLLVFLSNRTHSRQASRVYPRQEEHYNAVEGEEEIHEDEEVEKLVKGETIERNGEYWRIIDVLKPVAEAETDSDTIDLDVIRVYLAGPQP